MKISLRIKIVFAIIALLFNVSAKAQSADSISTQFGDSFHEPYRFNAKQLIAPGAMLAVGITGVYAFQGFKHSVNDHIAAKKQVTFDNYLQYLPVTAYVGLGFIKGVDTRSGDWRSRILAGCTTYIIMTGLTQAMKYSFKEARPGSGRRNSFPSGHTATAVAGAELLRIEYGLSAGIAGYVSAAIVAYMRIYNNRHWINDLIGGAAIGMLSARAAYWLLPLERKLFKLDKKPASAASFVVVPSGAGLAFSMQF